MADFKIQIDENNEAAEQPAHKTTESKIASRKRHTKKLTKNQIKLTIAAVVLIVLVGGYFFQTNRINNLKEQNARLSNPQQAAQEEAVRIKNEVGQLMELPDETPTVATVTDVDKLRDQTFFNDARNGDRVLLFAEAKKAVLYRPDSKKIIEVAPINIGNQQGNSTEKSNKQN